MSAHKVENMKMYASFFALLGILEANCALLSLPDEYSTRKSLSMCVLESANVFLPKGSVIGISLSITKPRKGIPFASALDSILLLDLTYLNRWTFMVRKVHGAKHYIKIYKKIDGYIIQIRQYQELFRTLAKLSKDTSWNPHAKITVISPTVYKNISEVLSEVIRDLWYFRLINVVLLFPDVENNLSYKVYTWYPFSDGKCGNCFDAHVIDTCTFGKFEFKHWFLNKIPKNLNGCLLNVRTNIIPPFVMPPNEEGYFKDGLEIRLINTIAETLNLTVNFSLTKRPYYYGEIFDNGSIFGSFYDLKNRNVDLIIGYVVPTLRTHKNFDNIASYYEDSLLFCVPHAKPLTELVKLTKVGNSDMLIVVIIFFVLVSLVICVMSKFENNEISHYKSFPRILFNLFGMSIAMSILQRPKSVKIRLLVFLWLVLALHLQTCYVTQLIKTLTGKDFEVQIQTLQEVVENGMKILLYPFCQRYLNVSKLKNIESCDLIIDCLNRTAYKEDACSCTPKLYMEYLYSNFTDDVGNPKLFCFKDKIVSFPIEMLFWKGFPLKDSINEMVKRLKDAGFIFKWEEMVFQKLLISRKENFVGVEKSPLYLKHMIAPFCVLGIGCTLSFLVFIIEHFLQSIIVICNKK